MATTAARMTMADLVAMPDDGKRRWLIHGELREEEMTKRNRFHSIAMANLSGELYIWRATLPRPRGNVVCGEAAVQFEDGTGFGVDVAYVSPEVMVQQTDEHTIIHGVPTLVAEITSPTTRLEELDEKLDTYRASGVPLVWVIDTHDQTVTIYRPGEEPTLVNVRQTLTGDPALPGFSTPVAHLFE